MPTCAMQQTHLPSPAPMSTSVLCLSKLQLLCMELKIFCIPVDVILP